MLGRTLLLNSAAATSYWFSTGATSLSFPSSTIAVDAAGNIYTGYSKRNADGSVAWQNNLTSAYGVAVDSGGNSYTIIAAGGYTQLIKLSPTGSFLWARQLAASDTTAVNPLCVTVDSSDNVYVSGYRNTSGARLTYLVKFNSSGTAQWHRQFGSTTSFYSINAISVDSSGNVHVCGGWSITTSTYRPVVTKLDSTGALLWTRVVWSNNSSSQQCQAVEVSSTGDVYAVFNGVVSGAFSISTVVKLTSAGVPSLYRAWQNGTSANADGYALAVSPDGNTVYVGGAAPNNTTILVSMTSAGALNFARQITSSPNTTAILYKILASSTYLTLGFSGDAISRIPADGSLTKTTGPYTYSVATGVSTATLSQTNTTTTVSMVTTTTLNITTVTPTIGSNSNTYPVYPL